MIYSSLQTLSICCFYLTLVAADVSHILDQYKTETPAPPPHPYQFEYAAGRFPGHVSE